jgi:hypothetical protein
MIITGLGIRIPITAGRRNPQISGSPRIAALAIFLRA